MDEHKITNHWKPGTMLSNYIKIAVRNILRNKLHSFINVLGLSIGIACVILLCLYIQDELSYDKHFSKHDRIYLVMTKQVIGDEESLLANTCFPLAPAMMNEYSFIEQAVRTRHYPDKLFFVDRNGTNINEKNIYFADPEIFKVLDHKFIYGSPEGALDSPDTIVLNETLAKKYFGDRNPVGEIISTNNGLNYKVNGVFKDLPQNTSKPHNGLITMKSLPEAIGREQFERDSRAFWGYGATTYILLNKKTDIKNITGDYDRFKKKYMDFNTPNMTTDLKFLPLTNYHLNYKLMSNIMFDNLGRLYMLSFLAIFILVIACINYINLATAKSLGRAGEVGVRKVLGAGRISLMRQFLVESLIITFVSVSASLVLVELALPSFNNLISKELSLGATGGPALLGYILSITFIVGVISGSYPAMILSSFLPVKVLGKDKGAGKSTGLLRKMLVVLQYSISIIMIICMILSLKQMNYLMNMDRGFNPEDIFFINFGGDLNKIKSAPVLREKLAGYSGITAISSSSFIPMELGSRAFNQCKIEDSKGEFVEKNVDIQNVDYGYLDLVGMEIIKGRDFKREMGGDGNGSVLISETFERSIVINESAVGKNIIIDGRSYNVIGVFKDVRGYSYDGKLKPVILRLRHEFMPFLGLSQIAMKIEPEKLKETSMFIRGKLQELYPLEPPEIVSAEDSVNNEYATEKMMNKLLICSAFFCTFVSCLGFFGLSSFVAENRTKEIGIRKVNGASGKDIVFYLTGSFIKLVVISSIIACPFAYLIINKWFERFAYKIGIGPWGFISGVAAAMVIAWLTVSFHSIKAAQADPVKALRYE